MDTPDWWLAEIVDHELRTSEIAVLRLRPDHPFPYEAGQYCSMETPWWPRVWRSYSMATAPRRDNLIELHVRRMTRDGSARHWYAGPGPGMSSDLGTRPAQ